MKQLAANNKIKKQKVRIEDSPEMRWTGVFLSKYSSGTRTDDHAYEIINES